MEHRDFFSDGILLPRQHEEIHLSSVLIFPNILKITGSKHYSIFCFDFFHSPRLMAYAPYDLTRCQGFDQLLVMAEIIYQDKWPVC